jgi:Uma2 family endonuclease
MATASTPRAISGRARTIVVGAREGCDGPLVVEIPADAHTLAGFRAWVKSDDFPECARVTFISGGIIIDMSKEDLEHHAQVKSDLYRVLLPLNYALRVGRYFTDGVLVTNEEADVSNNPDGVLLTFESIKNGDVRYVPGADKHGSYTEIEGRPDWIMEVVSNSSVKKDTVLLRAAYHKVGILEYWLIDARGDEVAFQILHWRKKGYIAAPSKEGWQRSRIFGRWFRLERTEGPDGMAEYELHVKEA